MTQLFYFCCFTFYITNVYSLYCTEFKNCSDKRVVPTSETHRFTSKLPTFFEECNCNENCYSFGDCCLNAPSVESNPLKDWSTLIVKVSPKFSYTVLMKTKCPPEWKNKKVRQMCENIGFSEKEDFLLPEFGHFISLNNDEFLLWHVTSKTSQITYRNIYCGFCNNETDLESWSQKVRCLKAGEEEKCSPVYYSSPPDFIVQEKVKRKPIQIQISSTCNIGWYKTNIQINSSLTVDIIKNCARFYAPVVVQDNARQKLTAFKNEFCAICSGYEESQMICPIDSEQHFQHQLPPHFNTFATFDTNYITGGKIPDKNESCPPGNVYNPFEKKCRLILISDEITKDSTDEDMISDENDDKDEDESTDSDANATEATVAEVNENSESKEPQKLNKGSSSQSIKAAEVVLISSFLFCLFTHVNLHI